MNNIATREVEHIYTTLFNPSLSLGGSDKEHLFGLFVAHTGRKITIRITPYSYAATHPDADVQVRARNSFTENYLLASERKIIDSSDTYSKGIMCSK